MKNKFILEFKIIQELKPNTEIIEIIKDYTYKTKNGKVKHLTHTNLQFIEPTEYLITYPTTLTILEYKVNDYCEPIIDEETWNITRTNLERNKHPNS